MTGGFRFESEYLCIKDGWWLCLIWYFVALYFESEDKLYAHFEFMILTVGVSCEFLF